MTTETNGELDDGAHDQAELLQLTHRIRTIDHKLTVARNRRKWSNLSMLFGPVLALTLYAVAWIPWIPSSVSRMTRIPPVIMVVVGFCVAALILKTSPGGPSKKVLPFYDRDRPQTMDLELEVAQLRDTRKHLLANTLMPFSVRRITYKEDASEEVDQFRNESKRYRRVNNLLQGVLIVGSLAATGVAGAAVEAGPIQWIVMAITFIVGISSGFMGYFKYKERSFYLQQTADTIEQESEAYEVGVGRYKNYGDDNEGQEKALADFVEEVHRLKSEQKKRQQNLEQPPDVRGTNE